MSTLGRLARNDLQARFFRAKQYAVLGASNEPSKYGHKVFAWYLAQEALPVMPIHPKEKEILGRETVRRIEEIPVIASDARAEHEMSVSVITPPPVTLAFLRDVYGGDDPRQSRVGMVWCQPGAEDQAVRTFVKETGLEEHVILGGPCILVNGAEARRRSAKL